MSFKTYRIIIFFFCFSNIIYCQSNGENQLLSVKDSLTSNPNYAYKTLSRLSKQNNNTKDFSARTDLLLGNYFNSIGVVDSSMHYTKRALLSLKDEEEIANAYRIIGSCYRRSGKIDNAMEMLFKSLRISEKNNYNKIACVVKSDLGILYANKKEYDKAIQFLEESNTLSEDDNVIYSNYINIGSVYFIKKDLFNAEKFFVKAFEMMPSEKAPSASATVALNIGSILYEKKEYSRAAEYYDKSRAIADAHGFKDKSINAVVHKSMTIAALGKPKDAIGLLLNSLEPAKAISSLGIQKNIYQNLRDIYNEMNNYKAANTALINFHKLKDSISNTKQKNAITELEVKYETAKKEKEILTLKEDQTLKNEEIKRQRLLKKIFLIGFFIILIPTIGLFLVYYQKQKVKNKYNKQKITSFVKEQELKLVNTYMLAQNEERSRISRELHDSIGGNLAAIKLQMEGHKNKPIAFNGIIEHLDDTYEQVRTISHNLIPKKIHQTQFTKYLKDYMDTISKVSDPDILFIPHPPEKIDAIDNDQKAEIFKIIQELITNALKHAKAKTIEVCLNAYADKIEIIFEDNGVGFDTKKGATGIGLQNIKERVNLLKANIDIDSVINRGTAIRIEIPVIDDRKN